jgi:hypothetical protein
VKAKNVRRWLLALCASTFVSPASFAGYYCTGEVNLVGVYGNGQLNVSYGPWAFTECAISTVRPTECRRPPAVDGWQCC